MRTRADVANEPHARRSRTSDPAASADGANTAAAPPTTRLVVGGDLLLYRTGLRTLLEGSEDIRVVAETKLDPALLQEALSHEVDVVLIDFDLTVTVDTEMQRLNDLLKIVTARPTLILTSGIEGEAVKRALAAGVTGIVFKCNSSEVLLQAIDRARNGQTWIDRMVLAHMVGDSSHTRKESCADEKRIQELTAREREIIRVVGEGLTNKHVGDRLSISEATVRHHLSSIFWKLRLSTRSELIVYAYRHELAAIPIRGAAS